MKHNFSTVDQRRITHWRNAEQLLNKRCSYCGLTKHNPPCERSDHGWTGILLTIEAAESPQGVRDTINGGWIVPPLVSTGCRTPAESQADILPSMQGRRHRYTGSLDETEAPQYCGYCVIPDCTCSCHRNEPVTVELVEL